MFNLILFCGLDKRWRIPHKCNLLFMYKYEIGNESETIQCSLINTSFRDGEDYICRWVLRNEYESITGNTTTVLPSALLH